MKNIEILKFMILHKKHLALKMSILNKIDEYVMRWVYYDKIRYLTSEKSGITYIISHNFPRLKIEKQGYCGLLLYWLSEFLIKVKITIFMIHF